MSKYKQLIIGSLKIPYIQKGTSGNAPLLFVNGFGRSPKTYAPLLDILANTHEVIAPRISGFNYFTPQPTTVDDFTTVTQLFVESCGLQEAIFVGHSLGGAIALKLNMHDACKKVVAINPLFPVSYGPFGLAARAAHLSIHELMGIEGEKNSTLFATQHGPAFAYNLAHKPFNTYKMLDDITKISYADLHLKKPTLILTTENDEYFPPKDFYRNDLKAISSSDFVFETIENRNHEFSLLNPRQTAQEIIFFLNNT